MMKHSKTSARRTRGRWWLLLVLVLLGSYVSFALSRPLPVLALTGTAPVVPTLASVPLSWPGFGQSAVGAVGHGVLATEGPQTALPTASIIKVMTALAVLKQKPLNVSEQGPTITLDQTDVNFYNNFVAQDGSVVPVTAGEQISEYQMLQALLLPSANNIATSLARWSSGSVEAFNAYANGYAKLLGLSSVVMTDPSGLAATTVASPRDLVILGEVALANPVIAQIVNQTTATIPIAGQIHNVNALLGHSGTIGIKTGNNDADLGAYLFASQQTIGSSSVTVVGVIMDGPSLGATLTASLPLIQSATQNFSERTVVTQGQHLGYYQVPWQDRVTVVAAEPIKVITWNVETLHLSLDRQPLQVPTPTKAAVGAISVRDNNNKSTASSNLELHDAIAKPGLTWRLRHAFD